MYSPLVTKNQNVSEIDNFAVFVAGEGVRSYLEIGSKYGASLWRVARLLQRGSRIVSVDLPRNDSSGPMLVECVDNIKAMGHDVHHFVGNSRDPDVIAGVTALGPFDLCYIDADHTLDGVTSDWENYGPLSHIVAFHDIVWFDDGASVKVDVPKLWNEIKTKFRHREIKPDATKNGIGILWK